MQANHTHAEMNIEQQINQLQQPHFRIRRTLHKMDRIFYDCILSIKKRYKYWIGLQSLKTVLVIGLIPLNYYLSNGFKDVRLFLVFVFAAVASFLAVISRLVYHHFVLRDNILLLKVSVHLHHSSEQEIHADPRDIKNCVSLREYNHLNHTLMSQAIFNSEMNETRKKQLKSAIKSQTHKRRRSCYIIKKLSDACGAMSMFYTLYVLFSGLEANTIEILVMYGEFIVEFLSQFVLVGIVLFVVLVPVILLVMMCKCCYNRCRCEEGWWRFRFNQDNRLLPQQIKMTQRILDDSDGQCSICLDEFKVNDDVIVLNCSPKHIFHPECIQAWMDYRRTCPNCRQLIRPN